MLLPGLLEGTVVATAGGAEHVAAACAALGATTVTLDAVVTEPTSPTTVPAQTISLG